MACGGPQVDYTSYQGIVVILYTFKVIKSLDFQAGIGLITRTLIRAGNSLLHYVLLFTFVFFGYAVAGNVMFGAQFADMSTIGRAFQTLMFMLMSFSSSNFYAQMQQAVKRDGAAGLEYSLYIWSFVFVGNLVLLNILLAIIVEAYKKVALESEAASSILQDIGGLVDYALRRAFLPASRFVSDSQLMAVARDELAKLREQSGCGALEQMARAESATMPDRAVLLGGGVCMDRAQMSALATRILEGEAGRARRSFADWLGLWGTAAPVTMHAHRSWVEEETGTVYSNDVVNDLMGRYGDHLEGRFQPSRPPVIVCHANREHLMRQAGFCIT